ncbi:hypothetical protein [Aliikangiella maris]|uniref:Uncharacterized protein n=1 Tax=Aliikangiella maris TaxID=3162458 RepID=A0ABV3MVI3_9GAMM
MNGSTLMWEITPPTIADLLATGYDPEKDYVMHIVDRGEDLSEFGENTFTPTWEEMGQPAISQLDKKHHEAVPKVINSEYQKEYAQHMESYWAAELNEFNDKDKELYAGRLSDSDNEKFLARHAIRTELGANSEFTGDGMTQCRHPNNKHGVVETLTLENNPPPVSEMKNVRSIRLKPIG